MTESKLTVGDVAPFARKANTSKRAFGIAIQTLRKEGELTRAEMDSLNEEFKLRKELVSTAGQDLIWGRTKDLTNLQISTGRLEEFVNTLIDIDQFE